MNALEVRGLAAGYGPITVLKAVDLIVAEGSLVALIGANGAGKSTVLRCVSGLLRPSRGEIWAFGRRVDRASPASIVRSGVAHVPERRQIFSELSVADNLRLGAYASRESHDAVSMRMSEMIELFPALRDRLSDDASALSGGQQQMLAMARGLMARPRILLLDEPSLGLAPRIVAEIFDVLVRLRAQGIAILLVEQNARESLAIADRAYVLETGRVVMEGGGAELLGSPAVAERYLGVGATGSVSASTRVRTISERLRAVLAR